jgi:hypothetical protein
MIAERVVDKKKVFIVSSFLVAIVVLVTPRALDLVAALGHYIPQNDLATDYVKGVLWALVLALSILLWPVPSRHKKCLLVGWGAKIFITLFAMLFYESHYGLDAYMYFVTSSDRPFSLQLFSTTEGTGNMINLARLSNIFVSGSYHAMKVSFAMVGLIGVYLFYRSAILFFRRDDSRMFYLLAFFPGILFWSSILGKEPVVFTGIALYVYGTVLWQRKKVTVGFLPIAAGIYIGLLIRPWLAPIMMLPLALLFLKSSQSRWGKLVLLVVTVVGLCFAAGPMMQRFKIAAIEDVFTVADNTTKNFVRDGGGSTQNINVDLTSPVSAAAFLPQAAFTALFRPLPGEVLNPFGLLAGIESLILLCLLLKAIKRTSITELAEPLVLWGVSFIVIWSLVNGIVSSANFGLGVRYKLQVLPLLLGLLMYLARERGTLPRTNDPSELMTER